MVSWDLVSRFTARMDILDSKVLGSGLKHHPLGWVQDKLVFDT